MKGAAGMICGTRRRGWVAGKSRLPTDCTRKQAEKDISFSEFYMQFRHRTAGFDLAAGESGGMQGARDADTGGEGSPGPRQGNIGGRPLRAGTARCCVPGRSERWMSLQKSRSRSQCGKTAKCRRRKAQLAHTILMSNRRFDNKQSGVFTCVIGMGLQKTRSKRKKHCKFRRRCRII